MTDLKGLGDLSPVKDISLQDILMDMMDGNKDLELKTQIFNPKDLAGLNILSIVLKMDKLPKSSSILKKFIREYLKYMVSYNRQSRTELINAVAGMLDRDTPKLTFSEKMTTNLK